MKRKLNVILALLLLSGCRAQTPVATAMKTADIVVKGTAMHVRLAETSAEQTQGLGGTPSLDWGQGMLFPFARKASVTFWMKDMLIPIDIIWLSDDRVVGIEKNVPQPAAGVTDAQLPQYPSPDTVNAVLETKAGFADKVGLQVGDVVQVK